MIKKAQVNRQFIECAFCGETRKRTGEHRFPAWTIDILPLTLADKNHPHFTQVVTEEGFVGIAPQEARIKKIPGDPGSRKLPIACGLCNSGWMSTLQTEAAPLLTHVIKGGWTAFSQAQRSIARWCLMTAMSSEFDHPDTVCFTREDRDALRRDLELPSGLVVWIGKMVRQEQTRTCAHRALFSTAGERFQATTMHIGDLLFQVINVDNVDIESMEAAAQILNMRLLWPVTSNSSIDKDPGYVDGKFMTNAHLRLLPFFKNYLLGTRIRYPQWRFDPSVPLS